MAEALWSPDKNGKYHLEDLMYNPEKLKERREKMTNNNNLDFLEATAPKGIKFYAAGVQFRKNWRENLAKLEEGQKLYLIPEPLNEHDKNAIQIQTSNATFLGYVPAKKGNEKNLWVKKKLLESRQLKATVLEVNVEASPWQALLVKVVPVENPSF